jgi:hypothetical protein
MPGTITSIPNDPHGLIDPLFGGVGRISSINVAEVAGLGDVPTYWPDLRVWEEGPQLVAEPSGTTVMVPFKIPWERHHKLVAALLGWPYISGGTMRRHLPESYRNWQWEFTDADANSPPRPMLYCTKTGPIKGVGYRKDYASQNPNKLAERYYPDFQFEFAYVPALFQTLTYDVRLLSDIAVAPGLPAEMARNVFKSEESEGKYLSFAIGQYVLENAGVRRQANHRNVNFWESFNRVRYEWFDVHPFAFNHSRNKRLQGKSNDSTFDGYPPGTLMLMKANRYPKMTQLGQRVYYVVFDFLEVPTGVNKAKPPDSTVYWNIINKVTGESPYPSGNMDVLFQP